ncbi:hypothetical protein NCCP2222_29640 [Sporosarcina sp. NCCP-2222]|uniref:hypothetical protein n=1 Tax=Sporosarcina sp. NCCP-2222 TaxID=2935073 RepID=UPI00208119B7|nr:hypothetical protein [Sporosarcina sp. NCCP-2222]GKV57017.1 hypothetical protein NCCP2222_29640 [Sporosarcina sp. NCCP-2222]
MVYSVNKNGFLDVNSALANIKDDLELSITTATVKGSQYNTKGQPYGNGQKAKEALIRSQGLINHLHELVKAELIRANIDPTKIFPPPGQSKPELKIAGLLKQKDQDICVKPTNIKQVREKISWGPLVHENVTCYLGKELTEQTLVINVRSQMSSLAKNADTLFERTFAEALNLHNLNPKLCLGEVYLIPVREYDDVAMLNNKVKFKNNTTNIAKYISFFNFINGRRDTTTEHHKYERCALLIVDFSKEIPKLYNTTDELKKDNLVPKDFPIELEHISINAFIDDLLREYNQRFNNYDIYLDSMPRAVQK